MPLNSACVLLTMEGTTITATVDGLGTISGADSNITEAGHAGILLRRNNSTITSVVAE